jgi:hypothetical protein
MKKLLLLPLFMLITSTSYSKDYMTGDQIKQQFNDMTFDVHFLSKDVRFSAFSSTDGKLIVQRSHGRDPERSWFINDKGQRCVTHPNWKNHKKWKDGRCFWVLDAGNGEIQMWDINNKQTHTFSNFRKGNQL